MRTALSRCSLVSLALFSWLLGSCATVSVSYDYDPEMDFSRLSTYQWLPVAHPENISELNVRRVTDAVDAVMAGKGYRSVGDTPDFRLVAHFGREARVDIVDWGYYYYPTARYRYRGAYYGGPSRIQVYEYEQGTMILDVIDASTDHLVWRGTAKAVVEPHLTPAEREQRIRGAVEDLLSRFPPGR